MGNFGLYSVVLCVVLAPLLVFGADWPQWGGRNERNMVSGEKDLPDSFEPGKAMPNEAGIDPETTGNVKWVARLGSFAYGNPVVANGKVFVGTDARTLSLDSRFKYTRGGLVKCLDEATGKVLWQLGIPVRTNLPEGTHFSQQHLGVCSSPTVEGNRVYIVTSGGDVVCLDVNGQRDGNDGPYKDEGQYMVGPGRTPIKLTAKDADIIWRFDPVVELGVCPHDAASCSVLIHGDMLYAGTSNGVDKPHREVVAPLAPSFFVLDKRTGRLLATDDEKIGTRLYHAQWSSPSLGKVGGRTLIFFGGGDGVCYAFEALSEAAKKPAHLKKVWSYDCNPPEYKFRDGKLIGYYEGDKRKGNSPNKNDGSYVGPSQIIATPIFYEGRIFVSIGQDPAHGRGKGMLHCIDATKSGDVTKTGAIWTYDAIERSISTVAVADGLVYVGDIAGRLHCLDAQTGECYWVHDTHEEMWGGPLVADGKLYFGNKRNFFVMTAGKKAKLLTKIRMASPVYSTPIAANGVLYVASNRYLRAVGGN